jgi:hypothetical protein
MHHHVFTANIWEMVYTHRDEGKEENNAQNVVDRRRKETRIYGWVSRRASKKHERG